MAATLEDFLVNYNKDQAPNPGSSTDYIKSFLDEELRQASIIPPKPPDNWFGEATAGVARGTTELKQMFQGAGALGASFLGAEGVKDWFIKGYLGSEQELQDNPASVPNLTDINSFDSLVRFAIASVGEVSPMIAESLISGGIGSLAALSKTATGAVAKRAVGQLLSTESKAIIAPAIRTELSSYLEGGLAREALSPAAQELATPATKLMAQRFGANGAIAGSSIAKEGGGIYGDTLSDPNISESDRRVAGLVGGIIAAIPDTFVQGWVVDKFLHGTVKEPVTKEVKAGIMGYLTRFAAKAAPEVVKTYGAESAQEGIQTVIELAAKNWADPTRRYDFLNFTPEQWNEVLTSSAKGGFGGAGVAIPMTAVMSMRTQHPDPKVREGMKDTLSKADDVKLPSAEVTPEHTELSNLEDQILAKQTAINDPAIAPEAKTQIQTELAPLQARAEELSAKLYPRPDLQEGVQPPEPPLVNQNQISTSQISSTLQGVGAGITGGLYDYLFAKLEAGDTTELGKPSKVILDAKPAYDAGIIKNVEDLRKWVNGDQDIRAEFKKNQPSPLPTPDEQLIESTRAFYAQEMGTQREYTPVTADQTQKVANQRVKNSTHIDEIAKKDPQYWEDLRAAFNQPGVSEMMAHEDVSLATDKDKSNGWEVDINSNGHINFYVPHSDNDASLINVGDAVVHELGHVHDLITLRDQWRKSDKSVGLVEYVDQQHKVRGQEALDNEKALPSIFKDKIAETFKTAYDPTSQTAKSKQLSALTLGQEIPRMMWEWARTGKLGEATDALSQAAQKNNKLELFLREWIDSIRKAGEWLKRFITSDSTPQLKAAYDAMNEVADKYGVLVNQNRPIRNETSIATPATVNRPVVVAPNPITQSLAKPAKPQVQHNARHAFLAAAKAGNQADTINRWLDWRRTKNDVPTTKPELASSLVDLNARLKTPISQKAFNKIVKERNQNEQVTKATSQPAKKAGVTEPTPNDEGHPGILQPESGGTRTYQHGIVKELEEKTNSAKVGQRLEAIREHIEKHHPLLMDHFYNIVVEIKHAKQIDEEAISRLMEIPLPFRGRQVANDINEYQHALYIPESVDPLARELGEERGIKVIGTYGNFPEGYYIIDTSSDHAGEELVNPDASVHRPVQITDKLREAQLISSIPESYSLQSVGYNDIDEKMAEHFDNYFGENQWYVKSFAPDAMQSRGVTHAIVVKKRLNENPDFWKEFDTNDLFVQKAHAIPPNPHVESNIKILKDREIRVHVITSPVDGSVKVLPFSSFWKADGSPRVNYSTPIMVENADIREAHRVALEGITSAPESDRRGQFYGTDLVKLSDGGWGMVEGNAHEPGAHSGWFVWNPLSQESYMAALMGERPVHAELAHLIHESIQADSALVNQNDSSTPARKAGIREIIANAGETQRGKPEGQMLSAQRAMQNAGAAPILVDYIEHIGDLSHRASKENAIINLREKTDRALRGLIPSPSRWSFEKEIEEGYNANVIDKIIQSNNLLREKYDALSTGRERGLMMREVQASDVFAPALDNAKRVVEREFAKYAQSHREFNNPVTEIGMIGKQATLAFANQDWSGLKFQLLKISDWLDEYENASEDRKWEMFSKPWVDRSGIPAYSVDDSSTPARKPTFTPVVERQLDQLQEQANTALNRDLEATLKDGKPETKLRGNRPDIVGYTATDLEYQVEHQSQPIQQASDIISKHGLWKVLDAFIEQSHAAIVRRFNIEERDGISGEADTVMAALRQQVIAQLHHIIETLTTENDSRTRAARSWLQEQFEAMEKLHAERGTIAGRVSSLSGKVFKIVNGARAVRDYFEAGSSHLLKVLGVKAQPFVDGTFSQEINALRAKYMGSAMNSAEMLAEIGKLNARIHTKQYQKDARATLAANEQRLRNTTKSTALQAAEHVSMDELGEQWANEVSARMVKMMNGLPRGAEKLTELELFNRTVAQIVRENADQIGLIGPLAKGESAQQRIAKQFAVVINNEGLYREFTNTLTNKMLAEYKPEPGSEFAKQVVDFRDQMANHLWRDGLVTSLVNEKLKQYQTTLSEIVKKRIKETNGQNFKETHELAERMRDDVRTMMEAEGVQNEGLLNRMVDDVEANLRAQIEQKRLDFLGSAAGGREFLRHIQTTIGEKAKEHALSKTSLFGELHSWLSDDLGIPDDMAQALSNVMDQQLGRDIAAEREAIVRRRIEALKTTLPPKQHKQVDMAMKKLLTAVNLGVMRDETAYNAFAEPLGLPPWNAEVAAQADKLGAQIATASKYNRPIFEKQLSDLMEAQKGINPYDMGIAAMYANMLAGPSTHLVNIISTAGSITGHAAVAIIRNPRNTPHILSAMWRAAMGEAQVESREAFWNGHTFSKEGKYWHNLNPLEIANPIFKSKSTNATTAHIAETAAEVVHKLYSALGAKYVGRALVAADVFFYKVAQEAGFAAKVGARSLVDQNIIATARTLARREVQARGINPDENRHTRRQTESLAYRILNDLRLKSTTNPTMVDDNLREAWLSSGNEAVDATFNGDPKGLLGKLSKLIEKWTATDEQGQVNPIGKMLVPFTKVSANVTNQMVEWTPFGLVRFGLGGHDFLVKDAEGNLIRNKDIAVRAILGTGAMIIMASILSKQDEDDPWLALFANGPRDAEARRQMLDRGWKPNTLKIGNYYLSYMSTPLAMPFAILGRMMDDHRDGKAYDPLSFSAASVAMLQTVTSQSFLASIHDVMAAVDSPTPEKNASRIFSRLAIGVTPLIGSNLVQQIDKWVAPSIQQADGFWESYLKNLPVVRGLALQPMLNVFGEPVHRTPGLGFIPGLERFITMERGDDPIYNVLGQKRIRVPGFSKSSKLGDEVMTHEQYYEYVSTAGPLVKQALEADLPQLRQMTRENAQEHVDKITRDIKQRVRQQMKSAIVN